jgi:hypothetical protein
VADLGWIGPERGPVRRCSVCAEPVVYERWPSDPLELVLVCVVCLVRDAPPADAVDVHGNPWHCAACYERWKPSGKLPPPWNSAG